MRTLYGTLTMLDGYMEWTIWSPDPLSLKLEGFVWDF